MKLVQTDSGGQSASAKIETTYQKNSAPRLRSRRKNIIVDDENVSEEEVIILGETRRTGRRTRSSKIKKRKASEAPVDSEEWVTTSKKRQTGAGAASLGVLNASNVIEVLQNMPKKGLKSLLGEKKVLELSFSDREDGNGEPEGVFAAIKYGWGGGCVEGLDGELWGRGGRGVFGYW
ncbi:unnamed protein product [Agarophyton chilense]